ncbi:hypothetical protein GCM10009638_09850 [Luteococcus sanguinis]
MEEQAASAEGAAPIVMPAPSATDAARATADFEMVDILPLDWSRCPEGSRGPLSFVGVARGERLRRHYVG